MDIRIDDLIHPDVRALVRQHLGDMAVHSPPESVHALDLDALRQPGITFWSAWRNAELLGCGALKELDAFHGEVKSMRTASRHLRQGVAATLLHHIMDEARRRSYQRLSLETGAAEAFAPARRLYGRFGFQTCGPFAGYIADRHSVFMTLEL